MSAPLLVDSHCHLNYPEFAALDEVVTRADEAGVGLMQTISTKRSDFAEVIAIAEQHPHIYASIGIHPHEAEKHPDITAEELSKWAEHPKVIGIGETGLDYYYEHSPRAAQQESFRTHITAARALDLPVIVHSRDADEDTIAILEEEQKKGDFPFLIHCFTSGPSLAENALRLGGYISLSGIVTFKKSDELRAVAKTIPQDRLLVETDAPYLAPVPHRGKPNEPAFVRHTAEYLATFLEMPFETLAEITTNNFFHLFKKTPPCV